MAIRSRLEYYGARRDDFQLSIKFSGFEILDKSPFYHSPGEPRIFHTFRSYRNFLKGLWSVAFAPPCEHPQDEDTERKLDVETATIKDFLAPEITERIALYLVKHCSRSRWLEVAKSGLNEFFNRQERFTMLRGNNCCEDSAVNATASIMGKWVFII